MSKCAGLNTAEMDRERTLFFLTSRFYRHALLSTIPSYGQRLDHKGGLDGYLEGAKIIRSEVHRGNRSRPVCRLKYVVEERIYALG